jgi:acyl-CoA reductase-like NAD-dependent aldehyde dehydrogenase
LDARKALGFVGVNFHIEMFHMEPLALMRFGMMMCSGQRCTAVKVVLAMECIADALVCKINGKLCKLTVGMPEDDCDITPVISDTSANFIEGLVQDARCKGARFHQVCCFFHHGFQLATNGFFFVATCLANFELLKSTKLGKIWFCCKI